MRTCINTVIKTMINVNRHYPSLSDFVSLTKAMVCIKENVFGKVAIAHVCSPFFMTKIFRVQ